MSNIIKNEKICLDNEKYTIEHGACQWLEEILSKEPGNLSEADAETMEADLMRRAQVQAGELLKKAHAEAQAVLDCAKQQAEQVLQKAYAEGRQRGEQEYAKFRTEAENLTQSILEEKKQTLLTYKADILKLIAQAAERIVRKEIDESSESIEHIFYHAVKQVLENDVNILRVRVGAYCEDEALLSLLSIPIQRDPMLNRDACIIETENGEVDASIDSQLSQLKDGLSQLAG